MTADDPKLEFSADRALAGLAASPVVAEDSGRVEARRERLLPQLGQFAADTFAARAQKKLLWIRIALAAVVAAAVVLGVGVGAWQGRKIAAVDMPALRSRQGDVRVEREGRAIDVASRAPFELGVHDRVETSDGRAEVSLVSGALVELEPRSELGLFPAERTADRLDEQIVLLGGKIGVHVPKLGPHGRLRVGTPNATVTVHGTVFSVEVSPAAGGGSVTRVSVTEGRVSVNSDGREIFLGPGANWSSVQVVPEASAAANGNDAADDEGPASAAAKKSPAKHSTLNEENQLFGGALAARRAGHPDRAVELVDRLIRLYPTSPLLPEANAERKRALADIARSPAPGSSE